MEKSNFVDQIRVFCKSGHGGAGIKHFRRDKLTAYGGPDGGDGGRGGHIILKGNSNLWTLLHLRYYKNVLADDGNNGGDNNRTGRDGNGPVEDPPPRCACSTPRHQPCAEPCTRAQDRE